MFVGVASNSTHSKPRCREEKCYVQSTNQCVKIIGLYKNVQPISSWVLLSPDTHQSHHKRPASRTTSRKSTSKEVSLNMKSMQMMRMTGAGCIKHRASRHRSYELFAWASQSETFYRRCGKMPWTSPKPVVLMTTSTASFTIPRNSASATSRK